MKFAKFFFRSGVTPWRLPSCIQRNLNFICLDLNLTYNWFLWPGTISKGSPEGRMNSDIQSTKCHKN